MQKQNKKIQIVVDESHAGERLDKFISLHEEIKTRARAQHLIDEGLVNIKGKNQKSSYKLSQNEEIEIHLPIESENTHLKPLSLKLDILFEDTDIIVINKPSGLVVHPAAGHADDTLVNALIHHTQDLSMKYGEMRPGIVHRLDKETSGVMVVAKNDDAHEKLTQKFKIRDIHRIYHAVCLGLPRMNQGHIQTYIARHPTDRKKFASLKLQSPEEKPEIGKWASTHYSVLKTYQNQLSYIQFKLDTGRTHQIRVHISELGHPIIGDHLYGAKNRLSVVQSKELQEKIKNMNRFALHATELGFKHPRTNKELFFKVDWPVDMLDLLKKMGFHD